MLQNKNVEFDFPFLAVMNRVKSIVEFPVAVAKNDTIQ